MNTEHFFPPLAFHFKFKLKSTPSNSKVGNIMAEFSFEKKCSSG
jgi:hypothetical protein